jgi:hypothetical protein
MGVYLAVVDHDERFYRGLTKEPFIVNSFVQNTEADREKLNVLLYKTYSGDVLTNAPTCECHNPALTGTSNKGAICPECGSMVKSPMDETLEPMVWLKAPEGIDALMNIGIYTMLDTSFRRKDFSFIQWLTNPRYVSEQEPIRLMPNFRDAIESAGIERGWNSFVRNFDLIFKILVEVVGMDDKAKHEKMYELVTFIQENRDLVFCQHIPLPNKALFVVEESNMGPFADYTILPAIDAIRTVVGIDTAEKNYSIRTKEGRVAKAIALLSDFIQEQYEKFFHPKPGLFRKQKFGVRSPFSFRAVISSITGVHDYLDMQIPWSIGCVIFKPMILNKLLKRRDENGKPFTIPSARRYLNAFTRRYSAILDEVFKEIIAGTGLRGYPALLQRNPSLERASMLLQFITGVKTDLSDPTISTSILSCKGFNSDFDGRALPSWVNNPLNDNQWKMVA